MNVDIKLGMIVLTSDGEKIGRVERLVVDPDTHEFLELIVRKRFPTVARRIVDKNHIEQVDDEAVRLRLDHERARELPPYVEHDYQVASSRSVGMDLHAIGVGTTMDLPVLWRHGPAGRDYHHVTLGQYVDVLHRSPAVQSSAILPEGAVTLDAGAEVVTSDGVKLGTITELIYSADGGISAVVARTGLLRREDLTFPIQWIDTITHDEIRLMVTEDEAMCAPTAQAPVGWP